MQELIDNQAQYKVNISAPYAQATYFHVEFTNPHDQQVYIKLTFV